VDMEALVKSPHFVDLVRNGPCFEGCTNDAELLAAHWRELYRLGWEAVRPPGGGRLYWRLQRRLFRQPVADSATWSAKNQG
jgi:hypothetical protein